MDSEMEKPKMRGEMAIVARKFKLGEEPSDVEYWMSQPAEDRFAAVEAIRNEYHGWTDETQPEFQRVLRVVK